MAATQDKNTKPVTRRRAPAATPEAREAQIGNLAYDLVERKILDGSASSTEVVYFLKSNSRRERLERERLLNENELLKAKVEQLQSMGSSEQLYRDAIEAFSNYAGRKTEDDGYED